MESEKSAVVTAAKPIANRLEVEGFMISSFVQVMKLGK
jgi:hypothetical protein